MLARAATPLCGLDGYCSQAMLEAYLRDLADTDRALSRQLTELLELVRQYGPEPVADAIETASAARAFGADYVANILRQQQSPRPTQPPLRLRDPRLNDLATDPLSLLPYDAFILDSGKESDDSSRTEAESTDPIHDEPPRGDDSDGGGRQESQRVRHAGMARRHGTGGAQTARHRTPLQMLACTGAAQHRCLS